MALNLWHGMVVFEGRSPVKFFTWVVLLQLDNILKGQLRATKALWNTKGDL